MSKPAKFRAMLTRSTNVQIVMGAYDALSAKIIERAGFECIWASGLSMSSAMGLRDHNEASSTQILATLELMADATSVPILVDGDSGYGNFNSVRRLTKKLCQYGLAAVCIEDTHFPKRNSFSPGDHPLISTEEFCSKLKAAKDSQSEEDFCVIARLEALVAGKGMNEALERAEAYCDAGADGILVHSRQKTAVEVIRFAQLWKNRSPLLIVPTSYHRTPMIDFKQAGFAMVIWANQALRAAMSAISQLCKCVKESSGAMEMESSIGSLHELFDLLEYDELFEAEKRYAFAKNCSENNLVSDRRLKDIA